MIECRDVSFSYDDYGVLEDVSFTLEEKEFVGIIGPNGGGKTTLLKLLLGIIEPQKGSLTIRGKAPRDMRQLLSYVPQYSHMDRDFPVSVFDVVAMGLLHRRSLWPWISSTDRVKVLAVLEQLRIGHISHQSYGHLSGGQQQRALIARALVSEPQWLLLDEPTSSIDSHVEEDLYELFGRLNEKMGIILVTHDLGVISSRVKKVLCVNRQLECNDREGADWQHMIQDSYQHPVTPVIHRHTF